MTGDTLAALNTLVTITQPTGTADGAGGVALWPGTTYGTAWAECTRLSGDELLLAQQVRQGSPWRVRMHYDSGVGATMRLSFGTHTLEITGVDDPGQAHEWTVLDCWEVV